MVTNIDDLFQIQEWLEIKSIKKNGLKMMNQECFVLHKMSLFSIKKFRERNFLLTMHVTVREFSHPLISHPFLSITPGRKEDQMPAYMPLSGILRLAAKHIAHLQAARGCYASPRHERQNLSP